MFFIIGDTTTPSATENDNPEFVGYIHNISPIKRDRYFDFELQGKEKTVRGVCFSPPKLKRFSELSSAGSPVKIKKFRIDTKSNSEDILMGSDVSVEPFPAIDFPKVEKPTTMNLSTIKSLRPGQTVTVTAKVSHLHPCKSVGSNNTNLQNGMIVDPSGTMKLSLWRDFVGTIEQGNTYSFQNFNIYEDKLTHEICISTALAGSAIEPAPEFHEVLAVSIVASTTTHGEVIGVDKVTSYMSCRKCNKKIDHNDQPAFIECNHCHFKQKQKTSKKHWFAQVMLEDQEDNNKLLHLTIFEDELLKLATFSGKSFTIDSFSQSVIESILYDSPIISVTFDRRNKVVETVSVHW